MSNKKVVIWDWNGTLLNDMDICISAMNEMLNDRNLSALTVEKYQQVFTFPVKKYYQALGFNFNKEPFEYPAMEFIEKYNVLLPSVKLFNDVVPALKQLDELEMDQVILSAMEQQNLENSVISLGINNYFKAIYGIQDHYAHSKIDRGMELLKQLNVKPKNAVLIGDTLHDKEVAEEMGVSCILVANGHQHHNRLKVNDNVVVKSLQEAVDTVKQVLPV